MKKDIDLLLKAINQNLVGASGRLDAQELYELVTLDKVRRSKENHNALTALLEHIQIEPRVGIVLDEIKAGAVYIKKIIEPEVAIRGAEIAQFAQSLYKDAHIKGLTLNKSEGGLNYLKHEKMDLTGAFTHLDFSAFYPHILQKIELMPHCSKLYSMRQAGEQKTAVKLLMNGIYGNLKFVDSAKLDGKTWNVIVAELGQRVMLSLLKEFKIPIEAILHIATDGVLIKGKIAHSGEFEGLPIHSVSYKRVIYKNMGNYIREKETGELDAGGSWIQAKSSGVEVKGQQYFKLVLNMKEVLQGAEPKVLTLDKKTRKWEISNQIAQSLHSPIYRNQAFQSAEGDCLSIEQFLINNGFKDKPKAKLPQNFALETSKWVMRAIEGGEYTGVDGRKRLCLGKNQTATPLFVAVKPSFLGVICIDIDTDVDDVVLSRLIPSDMNCALDRTLTGKYHVWLSVDDFEKLNLRALKDVESKVEVFGDAEIGDYGFNQKGVNAHVTIYSEECYNWVEKNKTFMNSAISENRITRAQLAFSNDEFNEYKDALFSAGYRGITHEQSSLKIVFKCVNEHKKSKGKTAALVKSNSGEIHVHCFACSGIEKRAHKSITTSLNELGSTKIDDTELDKKVQLLGQTTGMGKTTYVTGMAKLRDDRRFVFIVDTAHSANNIKDMLLSKGVRRSEIMSIVGAGGQSRTAYNEMQYKLKKSPFEFIKERIFIVSSAYLKEYPKDSLLGFDPTWSKGESSTNLDVYYLLNKLSKSAYFIFEEASKTILDTYTIRRELRRVVAGGYASVNAKPEELPAGLEIQVYNRLEGDILASLKQGESKEGIEAIGIGEEQETVEYKGSRDRDHYYIRRFGNGERELALRTKDHFIASKQEPLKGESFEHPESPRLYAHNQSFFGLLSSINHQIWISASHVDQLRELGIILGGILDFEDVRLDIGREEAMTQKMSELVEFIDLSDKRRKKDRYLSRFPKQNIKRLRQLVDRAIKTGQREIMVLATKEAVNRMIAYIKYEQKLRDNVMVKTTDGLGWSSFGLDSKPLVCITHLNCPAMKGSNEFVEFDNITICVNDMSEVLADTIDVVTIDLMSLNRKRANNLLASNCLQASGRVMRWLSSDDNRKKCVRLLSSAIAEEVKAMYSKSIAKMEVA